LAYGVAVVIVETRGFTTRICDLVSDDDYRLFQLQLVRNPEAGRLIPGTGGLRKIRCAASGRGKRGGARVIYFWHAQSQHLLMLFVYPKNEQADLTPAQRRALRKIVETEYP
jgi:hypothetical protein